MRIINHHDREDKVELVDGEFLIFSSNHLKKQVKKLYEEWLMQKARSLFIKRLKNILNN